MAIKCALALGLGVCIIGENNHAQKCTCPSYSTNLVFELQHAFPDHLARIRELEERYAYRSPPQIPCQIYTVNMRLRHILLTLQGNTITSKRRANLTKRERREGLPYTLLRSRDNAVGP